MLFAENMGGVVGIYKDHILHISKTFVLLQNKICNNVH